MKLWGVVLLAAVAAVCIATARAGCTAGRGTLSIDVGWAPQCVRWSPVLLRTDFCA